MSSGASVTYWVQRLRDKDPTAAQRLWERYFDRLVRFARARLRKLPRRVVDEEDVALSAFNSFCAAVKKGRFPKLNDRHDLWQVLLLITRWKALDVKERERRLRRGGGKVRGESAFLAPAGAEDEMGIAQVADREPSPEFAAMVAEEGERLLDRLKDESLRELALLKMQGYTNNEIAKRFSCVTRTVERRLRLIRRIWEQEITP